jgi:hypothetical protein
MLTVPLKFAPTGPRSFSTRTVPGAQNRTPLTGRSGPVLQVRGRQWARFIDLSEQSFTSLTQP